MPEQPSTEIGADTLAARLMTLYDTHQYDAVDALLSTVTDDQRQPMLHALAKHLLGPDGQRRWGALCLRTHLHPSFAPLVANPPVMQRQGVFYANGRGLRTRVCLSYFDPRPEAHTQIDYNWSIRDQEGRLACQGQGRIGPYQTHSFAIHDLLTDDTSSPAGLFHIGTSAPDFGSLRTYATWYNDQAMATTHEKGYLRDNRPSLVFPSVIVDPGHDTYLALANDSPEPVTLEFALVNHRQQMHPARYSLRLPPYGSRMSSAAESFTNAARFLDGRPGCVWARSTPNGKALFYYLIHNKEHDTWQMQHV